MNEDGCTSSIKDKILSIDVKPGWKEGTRVIFPKEGDQVKEFYNTVFGLVVTKIQSDVCEASFGLWRCPLC